MDLAIQEAEETDTVEPKSEVIELFKSGEMLIRTAFCRSIAGLTVTCYTHPAIENFIREMGSGELQDVRKYGRFWVPADGRVSGLERNPRGSDGPLMIYHSFRDFPQVMIPETGAAFCMNLAGWPILNPDRSKLRGDPDERRRAGLPEDDGNGRKPHTMINISFLRLAGTSKGEGVRFGVKGVYSEPEVVAMAEKVQLATRSFYTQFMKMVTEVVTVNRMIIPS